MYRTSPASPRIIAVALLALALAIPGVAAASPWRGIGVTLHDLGINKTPTLVVFGSLEDDVTLPITVRLPIPDDCEIGWVGEISGVDPSLDEIAEFELIDEDGYDVLAIEVTEFRYVQAELAPPADWIDRGAADLVMAMSWTADEDVPGVRLGFEIPDDTHPVMTDPAELARERTPAGVLYTVETTEVAAGDTLTLGATIINGPDPQLETSPTPEATAAPEPGTPDMPATEPAGISPVVLVLGGLIVVLLGVLAYLVVKQRQRG